jgi:hypothetical protein
MKRLVVVVLLVVLSALPAAADPSPTPTPLPPEDPLQVVVTQLLPRAPQPGGAFEVQGFVKNRGSTTVTDVQVRLKVGDRVKTRGGLHESDTDRPVTEPRNKAFGVPDVSTLAPGQSGRFDIRTTVQTLGFSGLGVYPLDIEARGNPGDGFGPLGLAPTWVPFFAGEPVQRTRVAVAWPLVDRPRQGPDTTFLDDELATSLSPDGRLGRLLAAGHAAQARECEGPAHFPDGKAAPAPTRCEPTPVTYAVDPDLLFAASTMSEPYKVRSGGKTLPGTGQVAAMGWLSRLKQDLPRSRVLALPYADPDVTAMTRSGNTSYGDDLSLAGLLSSTTVTGTLGTMPLTTVAWPPAGVVTPDAADALARGGARALVLDSSAYGQSDNEQRRTPSARTTVPTRTGVLPVVAGLVTDDYLSDLVAGALAKELGPRLAEQRFLAETAIIAAEATSMSRTLVIAPDRRGDVVVGAAAAALRDLGRVPWLCPVSLASVAADHERCSGRPDSESPAPKDRGPLRTANTGELTPPYLEAVGRDRDHAAQLTDAVLADKPQAPVAEMKARLRRAVARAESSSWRSDPPRGWANEALLADEVRRLTNKVVVRGGQVLLTSTKGTIQVSLENTLDLPVQVKVRFTGIGLRQADSGLVLINPGHAVPISVRAEALKSGQFEVKAQIVDRDNGAFGDPGTVRVRSTRYGRLALAVTIGGAGVLLVAAGFRITRRALHRSSAPPA